jgi:phosphoribosylamine---glycine ligase
MRILVVGSGGREHALAWKIAQSPLASEVLCAPGNPGIAAVAGLVSVKADDVEGLAREVRARRVDLVVVGPEAPLVLGLADRLARDGVPVFGPSAGAAAVEGSKAFAKDVMIAAGIPTAEHATFGEVAPAIAYARARGGRVVVKADGLAAGKGVTVCDTLDEAAAAISAQPDSFVVEERLSGVEASVIALCDGRDAVALPIARDHKRLGDGDTGPNTGGMGAYSPLPDLPDADASALVDAFHRPVLAELAGRGTPFRGALYAGLMLTADGPRLLEFNARFGDPETQVILPRLGAPLGPLLLAAARGRLGDVGAVPILPGAAVGIVVAASGYPGEPRRGDLIDGIEHAADDGALVFHAGTAGGRGSWRTNGGRVLTVVGRGRDLAAARGAAENAAQRISWPGSQRRHDIALDAVRAGVAA